jgi:hypothetical protein
MRIFNGGNSSCLVVSCTKITRSHHENNLYWITLIWVFVQQVLSCAGHRQLLCVPPVFLITLAWWWPKNVEVFCKKIYKIMPNKYRCCVDLTISWPAGHIIPTYKESFQVHWGKSIPLFLHAAIYLEVSLFRWTSQNAFSRERAVYKWYCVQCCVVGYSYPSGLEKTLCKWKIYVPLVTKV